MSVNSKMKAIADAIRAKTGGTAALTLDGMAEAVAGIEAGGGGGGFPNGTEWTQSNVTSGDFHRICSNGNIVVAGGDAGLWYSTDGMTWTQSNITSTAGNFTLRCDDGIWIASLGSGLCYSTDGMTWTQSNLNLGRCVVYGAGKWIASNDVTYQSNLSYSTDGMTWTQSNLTTSSYPAVCGYGNGVYIAGTKSKGLWYSTDGMTWTQSNITSGFKGCADYTASDPLAIYAGGLWVACTTSTGIWYSTDGMTWTQSNITSGEFRTGPEFSNGMWVAFNSSGACVSTDGMTWTVYSKSGNLSLLYLNDGRVLRNAFYAHKNTYDVYRSVDGVSWSAVIEDVGIVQDASYANGVWLYAKSSGIWYSTNGTDWTLGNAVSARDVQCCDGIWVAATKSGLWYSPTWLPSE